MTAKVTERVSGKNKTILHNCMYKDTLNGLFFTDTAESPSTARVTGKSKVALQIQPVTQQGKGLEKKGHANT